MRRNIEREIFADLRVRPPLVIRADGRGFNKLLRNAEKPYDLGFARSMAGVVKDFFLHSGLNPSLAFTFSDEVNLLFLEAPFNGRLEKLDSVVSGSLSGLLSLDLGTAISMDARAILLCHNEIVDYFVERQDETWGNHVFSYGFYTLIDEGRSPQQAMAKLRGKKESYIHEMLFQRGINLAQNPCWQRRGILVYRDKSEVVDDWDLPLFKSKEGQNLIMMATKSHI